ncbi:MAG TPA: 5'/3'-nucleotidase SurE, partial [Bacteroidales bacterium]|nr:5'/3'-nucleotidase SurE [Bacteroidales bacterium]
MKKEDRLILISNDDGVDAKGLKCLIDAARHYGNVIVAAPALAMSGMSHAITIKNPLRANKVKEEEGLVVYSCE